MIDNADKEDLFEVLLNGVKLEVYIDKSPYGKYIWQNITNGKYEPDTFAFLDKNLNEDTVLIDIGASDGPVSFFAATKGAKVFAYEPMPKIYKSLQKNLLLNKRFLESIFPYNSAVSNLKTSIVLERDSNKGILSPIVFTHQPNNDKLISVESISDVIETVHSKFPTKKILMKIDIEGAEWAIFKDKSAIESFVSNNVVILLALHPGFHRPLLKPIKFLNRIFWLIWRFKNRRDSKQVFKNLDKKGTLYRTNLSLISNEMQFVNLVDHGYHEWIIDFSESK